MHKWWINPPLQPPIENDPPNPMTPWNQVGCRDQENKKPIGTPALNHPHTPGQCLRIHPIPSHPGSPSLGKKSTKKLNKKKPSQVHNLSGFHENCTSFGIFLLGEHWRLWIFFQILMIWKNKQKLQGTTEIICWIFVLFIHGPELWKTKSFEVNT